MAGTLTAKDLARMCGTDGKRMRRFMRKHADAATQAGGEPIVPRVGQGNRYALTSSQAKALVALWKGAHAPAAPASEPDASTQEAAAAAIVGGLIAAGGAS